MSGQPHSALVRGDDGGLHVRRFASGDDARAASAVRDIAPEDIAAVAGNTRGLVRASVFAQKVGVSPRTVRRMYARGALPGAREDGPRLLKVPAHLLRLAAAYGLRHVERMARAGKLPGSEGRAA